MHLLLKASCCAVRGQGAFVEGVGQKQVEVPGIGERFLNGFSQHFHLFPGQIVPVRFRYEAGNHPQVKGLVYVAAGAPDSGQSFGEWWKDYTPAPAAAEIKPYGEGYVALTLEGVRKHFVQDIPTDEADIVYATQGPLAARCFDDKVSQTAWRSKPSWYIVAAQDETIPPAVERDSADRMGAQTLVLQSSHVPMLSQPQAMAEFIASAAASIDA